MVGFPPLPHCICFRRVGAWCILLPQHIAFLFLYWFCSSPYKYRTITKKSSLGPPPHPQSPFSSTLAPSLWKEVHGHCLPPTHPGLFLAHRLATWHLHCTWRSHSWARVTNPMVLSLSSFHSTCQRHLSQWANSPFLKHFPSWLLWLT